MVFHSFFNFGWILALQLTRVDFSLVVQIFDTPGVSIVQWSETKFGHLDHCVVWHAEYSEQQEQPEKGKTEGRTPKPEMNWVL